MRWFRSRIRFGSRLALFALAIQFLLAFGHFHGGPHAASISADAKRPAHFQALDKVLVASACAAVRLKTSGDDPAGQPADDCAICAVMALANAMVDAAPPCLLGPQAVAFRYLAADVAFVEPHPVRGAFQPRAPPIG